MAFGYWGAATVPVLPIEKHAILRSIFYERWLFCYLTQVFISEVDVRAVLVAVCCVLSWTVLMPCDLRKRGCSGFLPSMFKREGRGLESERGKWNACEERPSLGAKPSRDLSDQLSLCRVQWISSCFLIFAYCTIFLADNKDVYYGSEVT